MNQLRFFFVFLIYFSLIQEGLSQKTIQGIIVEKANKNPVIGASVKCGDHMTISDYEGKFTLEVDNTCSLTIEYLGFETATILQENLNGIIEVALEEVSEILSTTTITATKFEQRLSESTISVEVLKPNLVKSTNTIKVDEVLNKLPGVQVVGGQANIRGGSGFSYGAGSRVMLLLDDLPALQVDAGYANWGDLPVEAIGQIEVVKGASSALYGSAALNGIINFRRQKPGLNPETNIFTALTAYLDPKEPKYKWWDKSYNPYRFTIGGSHLRKIKNSELQIFGLYNKLESFAKETYEDRGRLGVNFKSKLSDKIYFGCNTLFNSLNSGDYFIWRNALRGIYEPFPGTQSFGKRQRFNLDPFIHYYTSENNSHKINTRYFYTNNDNNNNQQNQSSTYYGEYQYNHFYDGIHLNLTLGLVGSITNSDAELFGDTTYYYRNSAAFAQFDKKFGSKLTFSAGLRYEHNSQESPEKVGEILIPNGKVTDDQIISRLGLNYSYMEYGSFRASWGQGYRYPTVTERFIRTQFGGFSIFPNPVLSPEYGWSAEAGIKQGIKVNSFKGFVDLSAFISEYEDMIEFTFLENPYGFKPINIGNTRITGIETSISGQFQFDQIQLNLLTGYTFINPIYKNFNERQEITTNVSTTENVLKYRSKHNAKIDIEAVYKKVSLGFSNQYYSHVINIDKRLENPTTDLDLFAIKAFRDQNNNGYAIIDARMSLTISNIKFSVLCNNLINKIYTVRPGLLEAPRNVSLRLDYKF